MGLSSSSNCRYSSEAVSLFSLTATVKVARSVLPEAFSESTQACIRDVDLSTAVVCHSAGGANLAVDGDWSARNTKSWAIVCIWASLLSEGLNAELSGMFEPMLNAARWLWEMAYATEARQAAI